MSYRQVEHTADIALHVEAGSKESLFVEASKGLSSLMVSEDQISKDRTWETEVQASDIESLLVEWLNEIIFLFETEGVLVKEAKINSLSDTKITAQILGDTFDKNKHELIRQIKATTHHGLEIKKNRVWEATIVFDV